MQKGRCFEAANDQAEMVDLSWCLEAMGFGIPSDGLIIGCLVRDHIGQSINRDIVKREPCAGYACRFRCFDNGCFQILACMQCEMDCAPS